MCYNLANADRKAQSDTAKHLKIPSYQSLQGSDGLYITAVRRLRVLIEPEIQKRRSRRFPVIEAGEEAKRLMALSQMLHLLSEPHLSELLEAPPDFVTRVEDNTFWFNIRKIGTELDFRFGTGGAASISGSGGVFPAVPTDQETPSGLGDILLPGVSLVPGVPVP